MTLETMIGNLEDGQEIGMDWDGEEWSVKVRLENGFWVGPWRGEILTTLVAQAHFDLGLGKCNGE